MTDAPIENRRPFDNSDPGGDHRPFDNNRPGDDHPGDDHVDGNELAGVLREIFAVDVTVARGRCAGCGRESIMAETVVYGRAPGLVARCPGCESVLLRVVRGPGRAWLDLRGVTCLEFSLPEFV